VEAPDGGTLIETILNRGLLLKWVQRKFAAIRAIHASTTKSRLEAMQIGFAANSGKSQEPGSSHLEAEVRDSPTALLLAFSIHP
jgi:hypothetical protein